MSNEQNIHQDRMDILWTLLEQIYGDDVHAATFSVVVGSGDANKFQFVSATFPRQEARPANEQ